MPPAPYRPYSIGAIATVQIKPFAMQQNRHGVWAILSGPRSIEARPVSNTVQAEAFKVVRFGTRVKDFYAGISRSSELQHMSKLLQQESLKSAQVSSFIK